MPGCSSAKSEKYERLRSQVIEDGRTWGSIAMISAAVFLQQGMGVWMQLRGGSVSTPGPGELGTEQRRGTLPAPIHNELLAVLTGLVFNTCKHKESA
ncbi:MAG: hypothetical protein GY930_01935 [bacterium]|nr:hypothetical protein [bacterium]